MSQFETVKSRFIPENGQSFYLLNGHGHIIEEFWTGTRANWDCWKWGNVFRTMDEALENRDLHRRVNLARFL